jgi:hypothetical protein
MKILILRLKMEFLYMLLDVIKTWRDPCVDYKDPVNFLDSVAVTLMLTPIWIYYFLKALLSPLARR